MVLFFARNSYSAMAIIFCMRDLKIFCAQKIPKIDLILKYIVTMNG